MASGANYGDLVYATFTDKLPVKPTSIKLNLASSITKEVTVGAGKTVYVRNDNYDTTTSTDQVDKAIISLTTNGMLTITNLKFNNQSAAAVDYTINVKDTTGGLKSNYVELTSVSNKNKCAVINRASNSNATKNREYYYIKKHNITVNKTITSITHKDGTTETNGTNGQWFAEYGDTVNYKITVSNSEMNNAAEPYHYPGIVKVYLKDILPKGKNIKMGNRVVKESSYNGEVIDNISFPVASSFGFDVSLEVDEKTKGTICTNTIEKVSVENAIGVEAIDIGPKSSSASYTINDYSLDVKQYVSAIDSESMRNNNAQGFTNNEQPYSLTGRNSMTNANKTSTPAIVEKGDIVTLKIDLKNTNATDTTVAGSYATKARVLALEESLPYGLEFAPVNGKTYDIKLSKGSATDSIPPMIMGTTNDSTNKCKKYTIVFSNNLNLLAPGETMEITIPVKVTESNMSLRELESVATVSRLVNINSVLSSASNPELRDITDQNTKTNDYNKEYLQLNDLVMAGNVWIDRDNNGLKGSADVIKDGITVKLYQVLSASRSRLVATTTTGSNKAYYEDLGNSIYLNNYDNSLITTGIQSGSGQYSFGRVLKAERDFQRDGYHQYTSNDYYNYYIEFEYDGIKYEASYNYAGDSHISSDGSIGDEYKIDSNAYEFDNERLELNSKYETIGRDQSYSQYKGGMEPDQTLSYIKSDHVSSLREDTTNTNRLMHARSFINKTMNSSTNNSLSNIKFVPNGVRSYPGYSSTGPETEYLKYVNLALKEHKVDLSLDADVYSIKNTVNGEEMETILNQNEPANAYEKTDYQYRWYTADYNYRVNSYYRDYEEVKNYKQNTELQSEVTYEINLRNNSSDKISATVNELAIYYDKKFKLPTYSNNFYKNGDDDNKVIIGIKNSDGKIVQEKVNYIQLRYGEPNTEYYSSKGTLDYNRNISEASSYSNNISKETLENANPTTDYNVLFLTGLDNVIGAGDTVSLYVTFFVDKVNNDYLQTGDFKFISEISAYTTKYAQNYANKALAGQIAGMVDADSNPGNLLYGTGSDTLQKNMEKIGLYEDDTYKVQINLDKSTDPSEPEGDPRLARSISGTVFDDDDQNKNVGQVKASLVEIVQFNGKYYQIPAKNLSSASMQDCSTRTGTNGKYTLKDFIPGYYQVRFDYGDEEQLKQAGTQYNGQDYKSTKYYNSGYYGNGWNDTIGSNSNYSYFDTVRTQLGRDTKLSDALDDEIRRLEVNAYSETMTAAKAKMFKDVLSGSATDGQKKDLADATMMYAETTIFYVKPEGYYYNGSLTETEVKSANTSINARDKDATNTFNKIRVWKLDNVDFGLQKRPTAKINLDKNIEKINLATSDGKTLATIVFKDGSNGREIDKDKSTNYDNILFNPNTGSGNNFSQGIVYINMDSDLLQGATIQVEYKTDVTNESEIDYVNKNLDEIKYENDAIKEFYTTGSNGEYYSANQTAAKALKTIYYDGEVLKKIKKSYNNFGETTIYTSMFKDCKVSGTGYYGMYLGQNYYTGQQGLNDTNATLKVDHILDYLDNDFAFSQSQNKTQNRLWSAVDQDTINNYVSMNDIKTWTDYTGSTSPTTDWILTNEINGTNYLVDNYNVAFAKENGLSNLLLSMDTNRKGLPEDNEYNINSELSKFLNTKKNNSNDTGTIYLTASKVLSSEDIKKASSTTTTTDGETTETNTQTSTQIGDKENDMEYINIAEIVQYTNITGRRTKLGSSVVGNGKNGETDTDITEKITISPPTGLPK